jgi:acetyltransferase-like isoleucine patch superfamily enzyme
MKPLVYLWRYLWHRLRDRPHRLGFPVAFGRGVRLINAGCIAIGKRTYIDDQALIQSPDEHVHFGDHLPKVDIGTRVTVGMGTVISAAERITIGDDVLIGQHCFIGDHDHAFADVSKPIRDQGLANVRPVTIGAGSWLGANVTVLAGVRIGRHCVIGGGSVVTRDVPDHSVAVGNPARLVKVYDPDTGAWTKPVPS